MYDRMSLAEYFALKEKQHRANQASIELNRKQISYLMKSSSSMITYPSNSQNDQYNIAFEYVHNLFPYAGIKEASVYLVSFNLMQKFGFQGAEGFYSHLLKVIIISNSSSYARASYKERKGECVIAKLTKDEVLVHELLHYADVAEGHYSISRDMREEFAYGYSIGYLRNKNYTDDEIINNNFLPYLVGLSYQEALSKVALNNNIDTQELSKMTEYKKQSFCSKHTKEIINEAKIIAVERGKKIIELYNTLLAKGPVARDNLGKTNRFELLDLD